MPNVSVACIAIINNKILVAHRNPVGQMGGKWEFPGGKAEDGETDEETVKREMFEEFGIQVECGERIGDTEFTHNGKRIFLHAYRIFVPHDGQKERYSLSEHTDYRWIDIREVENLDFVDSDLLLYPKVLSYFMRKI